MTAILFVCLGNICRSPLAEGVFRHKVEAMGLSNRFEIDSAGCGGWHKGEQPDRRSIAAAANHGIDISDQRARQVTAGDFDRFDLILGLDRDNVAYLEKMKPWESQAKVALYLDEAMGRAKNVPDPYYGGPKDFEDVYRLCDEASEALIKKLIAG
ncbi:low molecular weight protein-tyrosine-phosphatase [Asticcacaulis solisilvae]|uniref:low molecular weight protein-tyrosine-phosphatase n=1 Tax=Asticcacaulis solisilvae TaxID=1217274 RepID=UPI003FD844BB